MKYPFVYIAALPRTGSTVISEALTALPNAFIFREPHIGKNTFRLKQTDIEMFRAHGINLRSFVARRLLVAFVLRRLRFLGVSQDFMMREFKQKMLPQMGRLAQQVGVKEIDNRGWKNYYTHFPNMKVILTGRDPRDMYLSLFHKWKSGKFSHHREITPEGVVTRLKRQFQYQKVIAQTTDCFRVRYRDLCTNQNVMAQVKNFVGSPLQMLGQVGQFNAKESLRHDEFAIHGEQITAKRVARWRHETDPDLRKEANRVFELMDEYVEFWRFQ